MFSGYVVYLLDANAIIQLSKDQIIGKIKNGKTLATIEDVAYEVRAYERSKHLEVRRLTRSAFDEISRIINSSSNARKIVKYYENQGTADIALIAYAKTAEIGLLVENEFIIVTDDKGLRIACDEFHVRWLSVIDFQAV